VFYQFIQFPVSHVWTVWVVFDRSGVFSKEPPRSLCCHDWVQLIRKYAAPAENQAVLVKLDYPLFRLISDPKHLRQCTPLSERRHPERGNQVARLRRRFLLESLRYKWTSHLSPEPRLVRVCTQTVPVVTPAVPIVDFHFLHKLPNPTFFLCLQYLVASFLFFFVVL
jgi:hypothetical protein